MQKLPLYIVSLLSCFSLLFSSPVYAVTTGFTPLSVPFITSALLNDPYMLGLYFWMNASISTLFDASANASRQATAAWIDLTATPPGVQSKPIHATMPFAEMQSLSEQTNGTKYPLTYASTHGPNAPGVNANSKVNDVVKEKDGLIKKITSITLRDYGTGACWGTSSGESDNADGNGAIWIATGNGHCATGAYQYFTVFTTTTGTAPIGPLSYSSSMPNLTSSGTSSAGPAKASLQAELDKMLQDPAYIPTFTDDTIGLPYVPPLTANVATPTAVTAYNTIGSAAGSSTPASGGTPSGSSGAGGASTGTAPSSGGSTSGGSAGTPVTGTLGAAGTTPTSTVTGNIGTAGSFTVPALHTLNFQSGKQLIGALQNTYPFNMLPNLGSTLQQFVVAPAAPVYTYPLPLGQIITIDLTPWNGIAAICRFLIAALMTGGFILGVINFWRGVA